MYSVHCLPVDEEVALTADQIEGLGPAFAEHLGQFLLCCDYTQTFDLLGVSCRGLLPDLDRKTCEPIALAAGVAVRPLRGFPRDHRWSVAPARDLLQRHVATALAAPPTDDLGAVGLHDETGTVQDGRHTPGVQRQYCGEVGRLEGCVVTAHTGLARGRHKALFDAELFLPQSWDQDRDRCRAARIPGDVVSRPKWQVALEQLDRALANGIVFDWFTFDEGSGDKPGHLHGLDSRQVRHVGEVPKSLGCFGSRPRQGQTASRADHLVRHSPRCHQQPWRLVRLPRQTLGDPQWEVKAARAWLAGGLGQACWLLWARTVRAGGQKYFVSNAAADEPLERIVRGGSAAGTWSTPPGRARRG